MPTYNDTYRFSGGVVIGQNILMSYRSSGGSWMWEKVYLSVFAKKRNRHMLLTWKSDPNKSFFIIIISYVQCYYLRISKYSNRSMFPCRCAPRHKAIFIALNLDFWHIRTNILCFIIHIWMLESYQWIYHVLMLFGLMNIPLSLPYYRINFRKFKFCDFAKFCPVSRK